MSEYKFEFGQTIYSSIEWCIGRYVFIEVIVHITAEGEKRDYVIEDPAGRKKLMSEEDFETHMFSDIEEARVLCKQGWAIETKKISDQIDNISDKDFDDIIRKMQEKKALQGK